MKFKLPNYQITKLPNSIIFILIFFVVAWLSVIKHKNTGYFNYRSEVWADKAGYYIYLPATLIYHFDIKKFPPDIDSKTGGGFWFEQNNQKLFTKYTYGIALLQLPFFTIAHIYAKAFHYQADGFSPPYQKMMNIGAAFYLALGLWFLFLVLGKYFSVWIRYFVVVFTFIATNLLYYSIDETLMPHVYSFFLFSAFLYFLIKFIDNRENYQNAKSLNHQIKYFALLSISASFAILIRPTNILFLSILLFWDLGTLKNNLKERLKMLFNPRLILIFFTTFFIVFLPQMLYWHYSTGSYFTYSYGNESFSYWKHPQLLEIWFSPNNGLFIYSPVIILFLAGIVIMIFKRIPNGIYAGIMFFFISYLFASWHSWYFGCSYGQRSFIDYFPVLCIPFGYLTQLIFKLKHALFKVLYLIIISLFSFYNIMIITKYTKCYFGDTWSWQQYADLVESTGMIKTSQTTYTFTNDFENTTILFTDNYTDKYCHSFNHSGFLNEKYEYCKGFSRELWSIGRKKWSKAEVTIWVFSTSKPYTNSKLVCTIEKNGKSVLWQGTTIDDFLTSQGKWYKVYTSFNIPADVSGDNKLQVYVWNPDKQNLFVDDLKIVFNE